jgi:ferric-dicitrate binding protein FerR (iron transport regulator)
MKILTAKYIAGQASEQEIALVKEWISASKENEEFYIQLYETWHDMLNAEPGTIDTEKAYRLFLQKATGKKAIYRQLVNWSKVAAVIVLIAGISYFFLRRSDNPDVVWNNVNVAEGTTEKVVLADGSTIWINAGSHLTYNEDFGKTSRTVTLDGEAWFDIAKSSNNVPFIIKTKNFTIRDIGTKFNLKAYSNEPLEATVIEGKISVEGKLSRHDEEESKVFIEQKQVLKINTLTDQRSSDRIRVIAIDSSKFEQYEGWKDNSLVFEDISFKEMARIIERKYNVDVIIDDKNLEEYLYTGSLRNIQDISKVMEIIKTTTPIIQYKIEGRTITISAANL